MEFERIEEEARELFDKSFEEEDEKTNEAKSDAEVERIAAYYSGWRDVLLQLFPTIDVDDPRDYPMP